MATLLYQRNHPMNRKQRLLEYLKFQESETSEIKANEQRIEKEIEAAFEELVADPNNGNGTYISKMELNEELITDKVQNDPNLRGESKIQTSDSPIVKISKLETQELEKYSEKFESVVETAKILHQQLQDLSKDGIILCEDTDVSFDEIKTDVERENSPIPQNKKKRRLTTKPAKRVLHITGDSTLEYFEDCQTIDDFECRENSAFQEKKKKRSVSKKTTKDFVHITGDDLSPEDFDSNESTHTSPSNTSETDKDAEFSPTRSVSFPYASHRNPENMVIGPNETIVNKQDFKTIDWALSAAIVTRKLLLYIFGRDILSTHSLTGKPSPAFLDQKKPLKKPLDAKKVADIIYIVTRKKNVKAKEVRLTITSKCADEQKMRRTRKSK